MPHELSGVEIGQLYLDVYHRLHRRVDEAMNAAGLSMSRAKVLLVLAENGPMNQAAVAARLGFAPRSVTDAVDALERDGLAERHADPHDRRARVVQLTDAGGLALKHATTVKKREMNKIFEVLDASSRAEFAALLTSMRTHLSSTDTAGATHDR